MTPPRVALFPTCLGNRFFGEAVADAARLLRHLGVEVRVPSEATCCGQPAFNAGHRGEAARMAGRLVEVLDGADWVVLPSGSCAGMIRNHAPSLVQGARADLARRVALRTRELSEFLVDELGVERLGDGLAGRRVAYHHGCHALRELRSRNQPLTLLEGAGAEVVPWEAAEECCGFGGLFSAKLPAVSIAMADRKLDTLPEVDALVSADGGCLMQLAGRGGHRGLGPPVRHLASLLWEGVSA